MGTVRTALAALALTGIGIGLVDTSQAYAAVAAPSLTSTGAGTTAQQVALPDGALVQLVGPSGVATSDLDVDAVGSYHVTDGSLVFQPALGFTGAHGVRYRVTDATGESSDSTYTPSVALPVPPSAPDLSGTGAYGQQLQCLVIVPEQGRVVLLDGTGAPTLDEFDQAGEVTADPATGVVAFTPAAGFTGTESVPYEVTDAYGQSANGSCALTVESPPPPPAPPPTANRLRTRGAARRQQVARLSLPVGTTAGLVQAGQPTLHVYRPGQGSYALDPASGTITFTPSAGFHGVGSVTYQLTDAYGRSAQSAYTPTVLVAPRRVGHRG